MNYLRYIFIIFIGLGIIACEQNTAQQLATQVFHKGALSTIMSGEIGPVTSLDSLSGKDHLYALGAAANLEGEIQIFDSKVSNSAVTEHGLLITTDLNQQAALLVYAQVAQWEEFTLENIISKEQLEHRIFKLASKNGIDITAPFPFLVEGRIAQLDWHVINWKKGDSIHSHIKHKESGISGIVEKRGVQIIGFYSNNHKGVFTHHTTNMHMHFRTTDYLLAGHVDDLLLDQSIILKLPKQ